MKKFGILGFGKMGGAFASGCLGSLYNAEEIIIFDKNEESVERAKSLGFSVAKSPKDLFESAKIILLAVKPQDLATSLGDAITEGKIVISILAGVSLEKLGALLKGAKIARVMPNTCATIKQCVSLVAFNDLIEDNEKKEVFKILDSVGGREEVEERLIDELIPISGSFTAYSYLFFKYFAESASKSGADLELCLRLVCQTAIGSANMVLNSNKSVDELIKDVCSKGGTTLAGLEKLDTEEFRTAIEECVVACSKRSKELGKLS